MPLTINKDFPLLFPKTLAQNFSYLWERGLMTPTALSEIVMFNMLPAKQSVVKNKPLKSSQGGLLKPSSLADRAGYQDKHAEFERDIYYPLLTKKHNLLSLSVDGLETLEAQQIGDSREYEIFFCGNQQDAMHADMIYARITASPYKNIILWNYPGVGCSEGESCSTQDLVEAGYKQAMWLIKKHIPAQDITLCALSLGGGVASQVTARLHEEGHFVNLDVRQSFASASLVYPEFIKNFLMSDAGLKKYAPLITSTISAAVFGVALGTSFAGLVATVSTIGASTVAAIAYIGAFCIQLVGFLLQMVARLIGAFLALSFGCFSEALGNWFGTLFEYIGYCLAYPFNITAIMLNDVFSLLATLIDKAFNLIGSFVGAVIVFGGTVAGTLLGLLLGGLLSIQLIWTDNPLWAPLVAPFSLILYSTCCEMNSVSAIKRMLRADEKIEACKPKPRISVTNVLDDEVIVVDASLNIGLGLRPGLQAGTENRALRDKVTSFWYHEGGHCGTLKGLVDPNQVFITP